MAHPFLQHVQWHTRHHRIDPKSKLFDKIDNVLYVQVRAPELRPLFAKRAIFRPKMLTIGITLLWFKADLRCDKHQGLLCGTKRPDAGEAKFAKNPVDILTGLLRCRAVFDHSVI